ncbi:DUF1000-domain-containing protein [Metschnikowia bicuspidata var. bicuspidata NRRL YB-4993]|uniref:DUF1000-domain-containing protein n=1 Tax=Metschnikowia bicuspidata var. bicuspidata NRRL YB-4993 TaxID=869754 RepID=A0A1A0HGH9_9ASCO|nr:DUF1000-domain-containing protein [Metschnikowia bicuspidata var. bicuspidata NRRL YB-4993]OBA23274.1 DUF1000-domain-containing protein [Metschnikowia bicuspidata var. bicuspidata NRRL YB-4993]
MSCENEHFHSHGSHGDDGHDHDDHVAPEETYSSQLLNLKINLFQVTALNLANPPEELPKLFKPAPLRFQLKPVIKSDADEQLIVHIPFLNGSVKLHSVILRTNGDKYCPRTIKLFKNNRNIDFDNVNDTKATFTLTHPHVGVSLNDDGEDEEMPEALESTADFVEHHVPRHVFTGVHTLTMFVENIHGDEEECHFHSVELRGEYTELSRDPVITIYELAANPADHKRVEETLSLMNF